MTSQRLEGCRGCAFAFLYGGDRKCRHNPHEYETTKQREIVAWLSNVHVDPMTSPGCPGYEESES